MPDSLHFRYNPNLITLDLDNLSGTPVLPDGRFRNLEFPGVPRFADVWKWQTTPNPYKA